ncbi:IclR family transcriptional regulator [Microbacterium sp. NPDC089320]|uniref:IclR family transcriptional regulator n=1 Tax=Microbacterium sp. NPDC089320 TaxID=3155182 RepID=UPI00344290BD
MTEPAPDGERLAGTDRVLAVLLELGAHHAGASLDDISSAMGMPKPSVHRALDSLCRAGLAARVSRGHYILGDGFLRLAFAHHAARPDTALMTPILEKLSERFSETAHYAVLDGAHVVYRAKTDPPVGAVRLTSIIGGRNPAHSTAVGKLLLSRTVASRGELDSVLGTAPLERRTPRTIVDPDELWRELGTIREQGFAVEDEENEAGVACLAVPAPATPLAPRSTPGGLSISALTFRTPLTTLVDALPAIRLIAGGDAA